MTEYTRFDAIHLAAVMTAVMVVVGVAVLAIYDLIEWIRRKR